MTHSSLFFTLAGLLVLGLIGGSLYIPPQITLGLPLLLVFWMGGMIIFGILLALGIKGQKQ